MNSSLFLDRPTDCGPSDSSIARHRWEDDGGACQPASGGPLCRRLQHPVSTPSGDSSLYELVVLPFAEYSLGYPQRLTGLHERLHAAPSADAPRFLIVDATRVTRLGEGALLDLLHSAAGQLLGQERRLVLACHLNVLVEDVHLGQLCHVAATREAAVAWCRKRR